MVLDRHARRLRQFARTASLIGVVPGAPGGRVLPPRINFVLLRQRFAGATDLGGKILEFW
jgi:hypothetical protein